MNTESERQNTSLKGACKLHSNCVSRFKMIRTENLDKVIVGTPNVNSISSKFDEFKLMVSGLFGVIITPYLSAPVGLPKSPGKK